MSDMASPILFVMGNESHAYIAFTALMERLKDNFSTSGATMTLKFEHLACALAFYDPVFYTYLQHHHVIATFVLLSTEILLDYFVTWKGIFLCTHSNTHTHAQAHTYWKICAIFKEFVSFLFVFFFLLSSTVLRIRTKSLVHLTMT